MESVTVKFQEDILKKMDKNIADHNYNSRTEFIREAVRDKLSKLSTEEIITEVMKFRGKGKSKRPPEDDEKIKEEVSRELWEELDRRFK